MSLEQQLRSTVSAHLVWDMEHCQVMVLAPFVDMANHDSNGLGRIVFDARGIALCMLARTNPIGGWVLFSR